MINFHLSKRPRPKQSINNGNCNNHINNNICNENKPKENLGVVGNPNTLVWLFCDLQSYGKVIVRQGHREGLPIDKPPIWTFCPLLKSKFPRDRILVEECKKCSHFKGMSQNPSVNRQVSDFKFNFIPAKRKQPKISFSKEQIEEATKEAEKLKHEEDRKWKKEEKEIFSKGNKNGEERRK